MSQENHRRYKSHILRKAAFWSVLIIIFLGFIYYLQLFSILSPDIRILEGDHHYVNLRFPFVYVRGDDSGEIIALNGKPAPSEHSRLNFPLSVEGVKQGQVNLEFALFGRIPLRHVTINVLPEIKAVPGGHSIGIKIHSDGVSVVGFYQFPSGGANCSPARNAGIRMGDSILAVEGERVGDIKNTADLLQKAAQKGSLTVTIRRKGREQDVLITPQHSDVDQEYRIGIYIRDTTAGVGTLSFYHHETLRYGALGHIIIDTDTRKPVDMSTGEIVKANIVHINPAQRGQPGEKTGIFLNHNDLSGNIDKNTPFGIFGRLDKIQGFDSPFHDPVPVALASQVKPGPAQLLTVLEGETIRSFDLEIERVMPQKTPADKGLIIRITDKELLETTGGIVQGMSGSPIIQDGKLIGVVTHVFVNDPRRGYGIFMEWMVYTADLTP
ncbi:MAG: SpoIVB peptidase [Dethiobacteria bacterium]